MLTGGYLILGQWNGVPIRVHWSTPVGVLIFSGFRFVPAFWVSVFLLIL